MSTTYIFVKRITITADDPNPVRPDVIDHKVSIAILETIPKMQNSRVSVEDINLKLAEIDAAQEALNAIYNGLKAAMIQIPADVREVIHEQMNQYTEMKKGLPNTSTKEGEIPIPHEMMAWIGEKTGEHMIANFPADMNDLKIPRSMEWIRVHEAFQEACILLYRKMLEEPPVAWWVQKAKERQVELAEAKAALSSMTKERDEARKAMRIAYFDGFNQAHYSHLHPETFPPKECEAAAEEYFKNNSPATGLYK